MFEEKLTEKISQWFLNQKVKHIPYDPTHPESTKLQHQGIDILLQSKTATIKVKTRDKKYYLQGILIEIISNKENQTPGWFYTSQADLIAYVWTNQHKTNLMPIGYLIILQHPTLRDWFKEHNEQYPMFQTKSKDNSHIWTTLFKVIPKKDFPPNTIIEFNPTLPIITTQTRL